MSKMRRTLIALIKDFVVGVIILSFCILAWRIVKGAGVQLIAMSPVDPAWFTTSWLKTMLSIVLLLALVLMLGRGFQRFFGRFLVTTPGFRRLVRSGELVITELSPKESQAFKVVLVKLTPGANRQMAILTATLEDSDTGQKLATVFVPGTPNVRVGETRVLPFDDLTMTNWTVSEAMAFLMSGGTVSPSKIHFTTSAPE